MSWESLSVRKAPHMYGWDIMPRLVSAGLWRGVRLEFAPPARWTGVYFATVRADPARRTAHVVADWNFAAPTFDIDRWQVRLTLSREGRAAYRATRPVLTTHDRLQFEVGQAELWWPRGYGSPRSTTCRWSWSTRRQGAGRVAAAGRPADRQLLRTDVTSPEKPGEFAFAVNGEKIFVKGSNWVPLDALHSRDKQHLQGAIGMIADLNCKHAALLGRQRLRGPRLLRAVRPRGFLVWQDFALACALYPQSDAFAEEIRVEAEAVVRKLRNHPSLPSGPATTRSTTLAGLVRHQA
jgi:beta-mannosidase